MKMKLLRCYYVAACFMLAAVMPLRAQEWEISDEVQKRTFTLKSKEDVGAASMSVDICMSYNVRQSTVIMELIPHSGMYEGLWLPLGIYDKLDVKQYIVDTLHGKCRMSRAFKQQSLFGIGGNFSGANCQLQSAPSRTFLKDKETARYVFSIADPEKPFQIKISAAVPFSGMETASGRIRYTCQFVADPITLDVKIRICHWPRTLQLVNELGQFAKETEERYLTMVESAREGNEAQYRECRGYFDETVKSRYAEFQARWNEVKESCPEVRQQVHNVDTILLYAYDFDPCIQVETRAMIQKMDQFLSGMDSMYRQLSLLVELRNGDACRMQKEMVAGKIRQQYAQMLKDLGGVAPNCPEIRRLTNEIENRFALFEQMECRDNPCVLPETVEMVKELTMLRDEADELYSKLIEACNMRNGTLCRKYKASFTDSIVPRLELFQSSLNDEIDTCGALRELFGEFAEILEDAERVNCPQSIDNSKSVTKKDFIKAIRYNKDNLQKCCNAIIAGDNVSSNRAEGENIIRKVEEMWKKLPESVRKSSDVIKEKDSFEKIKGTFKKL